MKRPRPYVPMWIRRQVAFHQARVAAGPVINPEWPLSDLLRSLFGGVQCHLDHDPPLRARTFNKRTGKYTPDANDPAYLVYRSADEHRFKTNVRGDGAQYPDRVLIKKARRLERPRKKKKYKWPSRKIPRRSCRHGSTI